MAMAAFTRNSITSYLSRRRGQTLVEYAFILTLIALVVVVMLITTGGQVRNMFSDITYTLNNQAGL
jgi:Flp pilus assembly pilin Flp